MKLTPHASLLTLNTLALDAHCLWLAEVDNLDDLPPPEVLQQEIIDHLEAALASFRDVAIGLAQRN